jgi:hypothetical protein
MVALPSRGLRRRSSSPPRGPVPSGSTVAAGHRCSDRPMLVAALPSTRVGTGPTRLGHDASSHHRRVQSLAESPLCERGEGGICHRRAGILPAGERDYAVAKAA